MIAPGSDSNWNTPGFTRSAQPLVDLVAERSQCLVVNPEKTYDNMVHRSSKNGEDRFHFNGLNTNYVDAMLLIRASIN
eukprot:2740044-Karenia_brevis.AAC.1